MLELRRGFSILVLFNFHHKRYSDSTQLATQRLESNATDGASNMSGIRNGVAAQLCKEEARAVYTHCYGHSLNLAAADAVKRSALMKSALDTTYEITKLVKYSPRIEELFFRHSKVN